MYAWKVDSSKEVYNFKVMLASSRTVVLYFKCFANVVLFLTSDYHHRFL